jgi:hypothetical protein
VVRTKLRWIDKGNGDIRKLRIMWWRRVEEIPIGSQDSS